MRLRNRVRATRVLRGIKQTTLADLSGISRMTLGKIEKDDGYEPKGRAMVALSRALNDEGLFWFERTGDEEMI